MCWLRPRVTWQPTLPRCAPRDRPTISPVASLGVRSSTKNEQHRFPKPQRRSEPRGPTSNQREYYVTINREEGSEGGGHGRLDRRASHVCDGRVDPTWPQPGGDRRRTPPGGGGLPPDALCRGNCWGELNRHGSASKRSCGPLWERSRCPRPVRCESSSTVRSARNDTTPA